MVRGRLHESANVTCPAAGAVLNNECRIRVCMHDTVTKDFLFLAAPNTCSSAGGYHWLSYTYRENCSAINGEEVVVNYRWACIVDLCPSSFITTSDLFHVIQKEGSCPTRSQKSTGWLHTVTTAECHGIGRPDCIYSYCSLDGGELNVFLVC